MKQNVNNDVGKDSPAEMIATSINLGVHRRNPTVVRHRCAQRCNSENEHSAKTAMMLIVMLQHWQWQRRNNSGSDSADITMYTLIWQWWQLTMLWQCCRLSLLSQSCAHHCHTNVKIAVTAPSVVTTTTLVNLVMLQRCHCHRCCSVVS